MRALLQNPLWPLALRDRQFQKFFGRVSGIFLAIALVALADGLIAQMRSGAQELDILPGQKLSVSGPAALKNPLPSDIIARFAPENAPLRFDLEGFFTGYWFGSGMWRGQIVCLPEAETGRYFMRVSFRGASAKNTQQYDLNVYANAREMQAASRSLIQRHSGVNPFILASCCGAFGILLGIATYIFGRRLTRKLRDIGLAQIYSHNPADGIIQCLTPKELAPAPGNDRMVLAADGSVICEARVISWQKGKLKLKLLDAPTPPPDALVCLWHPGASAPEQAGFISI